MVKRPETVENGCIMTEEFFAYLYYKGLCLHSVVEFCDIVHRIDVALGDGIGDFADLWGDAQTAAFDQIVGGSMPRESVTTVIQKKKVIKFSGLELWMRMSDISKLPAGAYNIKSRISFEVPIGAGGLIIDISEENPLIVTVEWMEKE